MKLTTLVLDTGGILIKTIRWPVGEFSWLPWEQRSQISVDQIDHILLTGGRYGELEQRFTPGSVEIISEIKALGLGAARLARLDQCYVVGLGSGTPILAVDFPHHQVRHLIGTGVGAGTIPGLGQQLLDECRPEWLNAMAEQGDPNAVNLTVGDIYSDPAGLGLPPDLTAGNFAKTQPVRNITQQNLAAGLFQMVGEVVASITAAVIGTAKQPVILTGGGTLYPQLMRVIRDTLTFYKLESVVPENALYATAWGALVLKGLV